MALFATLTRMWSKIGVQPQIPVDDNHDSCYGYTAVSWGNCKTHYRIAPLFNKATFDAFISQLTAKYPTHTIVLVMDNARPHGYFKQHGQIKVSDRLYLYFLPPYASIELNPVEDIFRFFRHKLTHNAYFFNLNDLMEAARDVYRYFQVCRNRVASLIGCKV